LLSSVKAHREGKVINIDLLRSILAMLKELGSSNSTNSNLVYIDEFEKPMLEESETFFAADAKAALFRCTADEYCKYVEKRLDEERLRADTIMDISTGEKLSALLENVLIAEHAVTVAEMEGSGLNVQIDNDRFNDLHRMMRLFSLVGKPVVWRLPPELQTITTNSNPDRAVPPIAILKDGLKAHIIRKGRMSLADPDLRNDPVKLIQVLLDIRDKYTKIVDLAFGGDRLFAQALKEVSKEKKKKCA
jgi:cullin 3